MLPHGRLPSNSCIGRAPPDFPESPGTLTAGPVRYSTSVCGPDARSQSRRTIDVDSGEVPRSSAQVGDDAYLHQNIAFSGVFTPGTM
jgi:hypothetical protein